MSELSSGELRFIFNTFSFLLCGALVMWMAAGFTMLEAGSQAGCPLGSLVSAGRWAS